MAEARVVRFILPTEPMFAETQRLRSRVLYEPFGISPPIDWEDTAPGTTHVATFDRGAVAGYGRVDISGGTAHIRHLCVEPALQHNGIGAEMLRRLLRRAREENASLAFLNARFTALGLYRSLGFEEVGPVFHAEHTHLPHKRMELRLRD